MIYVILILVSLALFAGFLFLTAREARTGTRLFAGARNTFDKNVESYLQFVGRVDVVALIFHFLRDAMKRVAHDLLHLALAFVEALRGLLRRLVVRLRGNTPLHRGNPGAFVEYMTRGTRNRSQKEATQIPVSESSAEEQTDTQV